MKNETKWPGPRKANQCLKKAQHFNAPWPLFDAFWRERELAILFGAPGIGKSVLATQIADSLTRGHPIAGFEMRDSHRRLLYVDLEHTDAQFQTRNTIFARNRLTIKRCRFAQSFYRERPPKGADLCEWLREMVPANRIQIVIVDSLSALRNTGDGTRETLPLMRRLAELKQEHKISVLVTAASKPPLRNRAVREADLGRSRVLCDTADSVFALGQFGGPGKVCVTQTRSRAAPIVWNDENSPVAELVRLESGLLGFKFDCRFHARVDEERRVLMCRIRQRRDSGHTFRQISAALGVPASTVSRLYKMWVPSLGTADDDISDPPEPAEWKQAGIDEPCWMGFEQPMDMPDESAGEAGYW